MLCEIQSVSSRIWTPVAVSISYVDNYYNTGTSIFIEYKKDEEQLLQDLVYLVDGLEQPSLIV